MSKLRIGVVGVGHIGKNHARVMAELGGVEFAAVYDKDARLAKEVASAHGAEAAGSLDEFAERVDAATVAASTPAHYPVAKLLLAKGKDVLIEKPITDDTEHAKELVALAASGGRVLQVGHIERFNPVMSALEKRLKRPRFIEAHRLSPYPNRSTEIGVVLDLMIHDLEIVLHLVREPVVSVDAVGIPVLSKKEDIANARIKFEGGCIANITASRISPEKMRKIRLFQEDAYLSLDYGKQEGEIYRKGLLGITREAVEIEKDEPLKREIASFVECCRAGATPKVSGRQATAALELAIEITRIIEANPAR